MTSTRRVRTSNSLVSASIRRSSKPSRRRIEFTSSFSALNGGAVAGAESSPSTETCRTVVFRLSGIGPPQPDNIDALQPSSNFGSSWSWRRQSESSSNFADSWSMISNLQSSISGRGHRDRRFRLRRIEAMAEEIDEMARELWPSMDRKIGKLFEIYKEAKMGVATKATVLITPEKVAAFVEASKNLIERYQRTLLDVKRLTLSVAAEILPSSRANEMASLRLDLFICVRCRKIVGRNVEYLRHDETDVYFSGKLSEEIGKGKECSCEHAFDVENGDVVYKIEMKMLRFWNGVQMMTASKHFKLEEEENNSEPDDDDVVYAVNPDDDNEYCVDVDDE